MHSIKRAFFWLSGAGTETLEQCPAWEQRKYVAFGATVLVPCAFAFIACAYALSTLTDNARVKLTGASRLRTGALSIDEAARLDLGDSDLILDYPAAPAPLATFRSLLFNGRMGSLPSIVTSRDTSPFASAVASISSFPLDVHQQRRTTVPPLARIGLTRPQSRFQSGVKASAAVAP